MAPCSNVFQSQVTIMFFGEETMWSTYIYIFYLFLVLGNYSCPEVVASCFRLDWSEELRFVRLEKIVNDGITKWPISLKRKWKRKQSLSGGTINRQIVTNENITFPQLRWRAVIRKKFRTKCYSKTVWLYWFTCNLCQPIQWKFFNYLKNQPHFIKIPDIGRNGNLCK